MAKWAKCDRCGAEVWFDAYVTYNEEIVNTFERAYCPGCEEDIKYNYTVVDGPAPAEM